MTEYISENGAVTQITDTENIPLHDVVKNEPIIVELALFGHR